MKPNMPYHLTCCMALPYYYNYSIYIMPTNIYDAHCSYAMNAATCNCLTICSSKHEEYSYVATTTYLDTVNDKR